MTDVMMDVTFETGSKYDEEKRENGKRKWCSLCCEQSF